MPNIVFHRSTSTAVIQALDEIFNGDRYADKVIEKVLKQNPKWGSRDRRFIAETTYNIVRWYRLLRELAGLSADGHGPYEYWKIFAAWMHLQNVELPNWTEFSSVKFDGWKERVHDAPSVR